MKDVCFLTGQNPLSPAYRFRVLPYLERLRAEGIPTECRPLPSFRPARWLHLLKLRHRDTVIIQRVLLSPWQLRLLRRMVRQVVFDFDDAVTEKQHYSTAHRTRRRDRLQAVADTADKIIAGNTYLASMVDNTRRRILVLPTPVDSARFCPHPGTNPVPVIVWSGTAGNLPYLRRLAPVLRSLAQEQGYLLRIVCDHPLQEEGVPADERRWTPEREVDDIATADIGIMPLPDDAYTRGKCGYKLLLAMSCGLPCIASPVGINPEIAASGAAAILAESDAEWREALRRLLQDEALGARLGRKARQRVAEEYSIASCFPRLLEFLQG